MNISIRALSLHEWPAFKAMRLKALQNNSGVYGAHYLDNLQRPDQAWQESLSRTDACIFGLFDDEKLVGLTGIFIQQNNPYQADLVMSYIDPPYRGRGLSALFYQARFAWALAQPGLKILCIGHRLDNEPSRRAILRHGFKLTGSVEKTWPDGAVELGCDYTIDLDSLRQRLPL